MLAQPHPYLTSGLTANLARGDADRRRASNGARNAVRNLPRGQREAVLAFDWQDLRSASMLVATQCMRSFSPRSTPTFAASRSKRIVRASGIAPRKKIGVGIVEPDVRLLPRELIQHRNVVSPIEVRGVRWGLRLLDEPLPGDAPHAATPTDRKSVEPASSPQEFCTRLFDTLGGHAVPAVAKRWLWHPRLARVRRRQR